jgi:aminopeptidase N
MRMRDETGQSLAIQRADYSAPAFWIDTVDLTLDLDPAKTRVLNKMTLRRNPDVPAQALKQKQRSRLRPCYVMQKAM